MRMPTRSRLRCPAGADRTSSSIAQDRLGGWVEGGQTIEPIDFFIEDETLDQLLPNMMDSMTYRGTVYGLPLNYKSITLIYNKKLVTLATLDQHGTRRARQALHQCMPVGKFGLAYEYSNYFFHAALMNAFGGGVFDADANPTIDRQAERGCDQADAGVVPERRHSFRRTPPRRSSARCSTPATPRWCSRALGFLRKSSRGSTSASRSCRSVDELGGEPMRPWLTIEGVYVSAASAHKEEAYDFATFLVSEEAGLVLALEGRQLPTNRHVYEDPDALRRIPSSRPSASSSRLPCPCPTTPR
jgi:arabinogalactan oligomer / maltooligosaccharide transport system substrate-binding protein